MNARLRGRNLKSRRYMRFARTWRKATHLQADWRFDRSARAAASGLVYLDLIDDVMEVRGFDYKTA